MKPKSIWKSKTFWVQIMSIAASVTGIIPLPPEASAIILGLINIALRAVTKDPVHIGL